MLLHNSLGIMWIGCALRHAQKSGWLFLLLLLLVYILCESSLVQYQNTLFLPYNTIQK